MADGLYYVDSRAPHISADIPAVTLTAAAQVIVPLGNVPVLGSNYFSFVGKAVRIRIGGRITTAGTPGTGTLTLWWGNGTSANGSSFAASAAATLIASQTSMTWTTEIIVRCRAIGASGSLITTGNMQYNPAVVAGSGQPIMIPGTAPAAQTLDLTAANVITPQYARSGSTVETIQVHDWLFEALN